MPDRLDDLRRQRALVQEQLAWLDREIASLKQPSPPSTPVADAPGSRLVPPPVDPAFEVPNYEPDPMSAQRDTRRGCLLLAALVLVLLAGAAVAIYFLGYRDHPVFFAR